MAFLNLRDVANRRIEFAEGIAGGSLQGDLHKDHQPAAQLARVEMGMITADEAITLEALDPFLAGGGGQAHLPRQLRETDTGILLQMPQDIAVDTA